MKLIILGPPGSGKGTQANIIKEEFKIPQISTGDILRQEVSSGSGRGQELKKIMDSGALVSDELILDIVKSRVAEDDCTHGYLFDGFPRTVTQAEGMKEHGIDVEQVIELTVDDDEIIKRMSGRRVHPGSGRTYHQIFNPPKMAGKDDVTGEPLIQRDDDSEETVKRRLQVYHSQTAPLIQYYSKWAESDDPNAPNYHRIYGSGDVSKISQNIISKLKKRGL
jgi:adenylate kinase